MSNNQEYYDDMTGKILKKELVMNAWLEQLEEVNKFNVYNNSLSISAGVEPERTVCG